MDLISRMQDLVGVFIIVTNRQKEKSLPYLHTTVQVYMEGLVYKI